MLLYLLASAAVSSAAQPWDQPFAAPTAIVTAAATLSRGDTDVAFLLEDYRYRIDKDGATVSTYRRVYKILTANAIDDWASLEQTWEPWHEVRPQVRARVLSPNGSEHWLDAKTIADAPAIQLDNTIFSDARMLRAPLPAVTEGSVVEYEIVQQDTAPLFAAGVTRKLELPPASPVERFHVSIDGAKNIDLRTGSSLIPSSAITRAESKTGTHVEVELPWREPAKDFEFSVPGDQPQSPEFRFSTGTSWQNVSAAYSRLIAARLNGSPSVLADLGLKEYGKYANAREAAEKLTSVLHRQVRYTGVEFGAASIIPNLPQEVVRRHYGDCKDKATLLVTLLRAAGWDAHLALLSAGFGEDVDPDLPGFGLFNHAIVIVNGKEPLWIDATADTARIGTLPVQDQGRLALVVDEAATSLIKTPLAQAADNQVVHHVEVHLGESGKGRIHEEVEARGGFELQMRAFYGGNDREVKAAVERFGKNSFNGESVSTFQVTKKDDFTQPFRLTMDVQNTSASITALQDAAVQLSNGFLFESLPFGLMAGAASPGSEEKKRKHDFLIHVPYQAEVHFKIYPPSGFTARDLPIHQQLDTAEAGYRMESKREDDGTVLLDYYFKLTKTRLRPQEVDHLRSELSKYVGDSGQRILFAYRGADLMAIGKTAEALDLARNSVREHPENVLAQMRFSQMLTAAGAGQASLTTAQKAVEDDPKSARAWLFLAYAYEHDSFGRLRAGDWHPEKAEKALRKSMELDANDTEPKYELAILLEHDAAGERYGKDARLADAVTLYQQILAKPSNPNVTRNLAMALLHMGKYPEAQQELRKAGPLPMLADLGIALTALTGSTERAILSSKDQFPDDAARGQVLARAGLILYQIRRYETGLELLRMTQRLNNDAEAQKALQFYAATQPYEKLLQPKTSPSAPVQQFLLLAAKPASTRDQLSLLISTHTSAEAWQTRLEETRVRLGLIRANINQFGGSSESISDLVISHAKVEVADSVANSSIQTVRLGPRGPGGLATLQHVSTTARSPRETPAALVTVTSPLNLGVLTFFVSQEDGQWKLLATGDGLQDIGRLALRALAQNDLPAAQAWLDMVKDNALPLSPQDDKGPAIRYLWAGSAPETRSALFAKAAAASLVGTYTGSDEAALILRQIAEHPARYMERDDVNFALCETLRQAKEWKQLRAAAEQLRNSPSYAESAIRLIGEALINLQDWTALAKLAEAHLSVAPKEHSALQFAAIAAMARRDFPSAAKYVDETKGALYGSYLPDDLLAQWNAILSGKTVDDLLDGNIFSALTRGLPYAYSLALTQLRSGKDGDCHKSLILALNIDHSDPSGLAWLVQAELLKRYSLDQAAASAWEHARAKGGWDRLAFAPLLLKP